MLRRNNTAVRGYDIHQSTLVFATISVMRVVLSSLLLGGLLFILTSCGGAQQAVMKLDTEQKPVANPAAMTTAHEAVLLVTARPSKDAAVQRLRLTWARLTMAARVHDIVEVKGVLGNTRARFEIIDDAAGGVSVKIVGLRAGQESEARRALALLPPPRSLGYWLSGKSDPSYSALETVAVGTLGLARIVQHGWEVQYESFDADGRPLRLMLRAAPTISLPETITLGEIPPPPPHAEVLVEITLWLSNA